MGAATRAVAWVKEDRLGVEFAEVVLASEQLAATGVAIGAHPMAYRLDYTLETGSVFITTRLRVTTRGQGWGRMLDLRRADSGTWSAQTTTDGDVSLPPCGGDTSAFDGALDCDLGLSPLTNSMPVLRHGLLRGGGSLDFRMAWVSVPDLGVRLSRQRYTFINAEADRHVVRYASLDSDFTADLTFDADGIVIDYPRLGRRIS